MQPPLIYSPSPTPSRRQIRDLPTEDRPLYRLDRHGSRALATTELLALVLGTNSAPSLADDLLQRFHSLHQLARTSKEQLMKIAGIGQVQASRLVAILELSRRLHAPPADERPQITSPAGAANLFFPRLQHLPQEELHVMLLDTRNRVVGIHTIYRGNLNTSVIRVGEIFRPAIEAPSATIIVAHNHPSGDCEPSVQDIRVTRQMIKAGQLLSIDLLDHLIIGRGRYVSLKERRCGFD